MLAAAVVCWQQLWYVGSALYTCRSRACMGWPPAGLNTELMVVAVVIGCRNVEPRSLGMIGIDTFAHTHGHPHPPPSPHSCPVLPLL